MAAISASASLALARRSVVVSVAVRCKATTTVRQSVSIAASDCSADPLAAVAAQIGGSASRIQPSSGGSDGGYSADYPEFYYGEQDSVMTENINGTKKSMEEEELRSTWEHRAWVAVGCVAIGGVMARGLAKGGGGGAEVAAAAIAAAYVTADFATGIYHWGVDNYGSSRTPIFGAQIEAFQGHHERPWTIAKREVANNLHALAKGAALAMAGVWALGGTAPGAADEFAAAFAAFVVLSQQIHAWAHSRKSELPPLVLALQAARVLLPRREHGSHHRPPFEGHYCIVSGHWNGILDGFGFFRALEKFIFANYGVAPRSWTAPSKQAADSSPNESL